MNEVLFKIKVSVFHLILIAIIFVIFGLTIWAGWVGIPDEDAAILYNYSRNLAETGVISYSQYGVRAEGATDFGWMLSIALFQKIGISNHISTAFLNILLLALFGYRLFTIKKTLDVASNWTDALFPFSAFLIIIYTCGASLSGLGGFSTIAQASLLATIYASCFFKTYDALFLASTIYYVLLRPDSIGYYLVLVGSCFVIDLVFRRHRCSSQISSLEQIFNSTFLRRLYYSLIPVLAFAFYWLSRWVYFGNPFPLPYYVKASQEFSLDYAALRIFNEFFGNSFNGLSICVVVLIISLVIMSSMGSLNGSTLVSGNTCDDALKFQALGSLDYYKASSLPWSKAICVLALFYIYQSLYLSRFNLLQNVWDRFHVPLLSISVALLSCFLLLHSPLTQLQWRRTAPSALLILALLAFVTTYVTINFNNVVNGYKHYFLSRTNNNIYDLAVELSMHNGRSKTPKMFVTEAGILSYYSRIPSVDTWGLNTEEYSVNPLQDPLHVKREMPDLIAMHVDFSRLSLSRNGKQNLVVGRNCQKSGDPFNYEYCGWHQMTQALFDGATELGYEMYLVSINKNFSARDGKLLFMVNPSSSYAGMIRRAICGVHGLKIIDKTSLKNFNW